ncbi:Sybindin-like family-domain-containing protein [Spinellus fusiger]|nr:Sybindin-like family-domain-containing protein [Spinellus fusiger]
MTVYNLYIFDRHCQCIYYQKWSHQPKAVTNNSGSVNGMSQTGSSRLGLTSSRFSASSPGSSNADTVPNSSSMTRGEDRMASQTVGTQQGTQQSGLAAGSVISIEEEAKLVYGVVLSLRNFVRKLSKSQDGFISYKTSTYRLHYYETPTGLKFVMNSDPNTESLRTVLKQIYVQLYVEFVVKNGLMRFDDTRWEVTQGFTQLQQQQHQQAVGIGREMNENSSVSLNTTHTGSTPQPHQTLSGVPGSISNELFRIAVDRFIRSLSVFE